LRISGTGYMQVDPFIKGTGAAFMIGTPDAPGTMPRGEIIIEDSGRIEILEDGFDEMYLDFGNADSSVNQIIIRDNGELSMYGDPATMGRVGADDTETSLQDMINLGLITNDQGGTIEATGTNPTVIKATGVSSVEDKAYVTTLTYALNQNYPNPFNPTTNIQFQIPRDGYVTLTVYNSVGQQVATLVDSNMKSGMHQVTFDAAKFSSGIYFYKIKAGDFMQMNKMLLMK